MLNLSIHVFAPRPPDEGQERNYICSRNWRKRIERRKRKEWTGSRKNRWRKPIWYHQQIHTRSVRLFVSTFFFYGYLISYQCFNRIITTKKNRTKKNNANEWTAKPNRWIKRKKRRTHQIDIMLNYHKLYLLFLPEVDSSIPSPKICNYNVDRMGSHHRMWCVAGSARGAGRCDAVSHINMYTYFVYSKTRLICHQFNQNL